jgi:hypothetical protein
MINKSVGAKLACAKSAAFKIIYLYRVGDGNQGAGIADRPLKPHGAPRITLLPRFKLMI